MAFAAILASALSWLVLNASAASLVQDTFQRPAQPGWGTASDGSVWSLGSGLSIVGNHGAISYSGSSQYELLGTANVSKRSNRGRERRQKNDRPS